jgi:hypothetical protein
LRQYKRGVARVTLRAASRARQVLLDKRVLFEGMNF